MDPKGVHHYPDYPHGSQTHYQGFQPPPYESTVPPTTYQPATVVTQVVRTQHLGPNPQVLRCPSCQADILTRIDYESSTKTHLFAALLCLLFWPCVWIPYVVDTCKNANHYCPSCGSYLGSYSQ